jgi:hypothetical protein
MTGGVSPIFKREDNNDALYQEVMEGYAPHKALDTQIGGNHYKDYAIQPIEFLMANGVPFVEGNCVKYVIRWRDKGGVDDLRKARHYLDILIAHADAEEARGVKFGR